MVTELTSPLFGVDSMQLLHRLIFNVHLPRQLVPCADGPHQKAEQLKEIVIGIAVFFTSTSFRNSSHFLFLLVRFKKKTTFALLAKE